MSDANFAEILDRPMDEVKPPPVLPVGDYMWRIVGQPRFDKSQKKQTKFVEFTCEVVQPLENVDQEQLAAFEDGVQGKKRTITFYLTEDSLFRLKDFLADTLGISGVSLKEGIAMAPGQTFVGNVTHSTSDDGTQIYANIGKTRAV